MDSRHFAMKRIHIFVSDSRYLVVVVSIAFKIGSKWSFETISLAPKQEVHVEPEAKKELDWMWKKATGLFYLSTCMLFWMLS